MNADYDNVESRVEDKIFYVCFFMTYFVEVHGCAKESGMDALHFEAPCER